MDTLLPVWRRIREQVRDLPAHLLNESQALHVLLDREHIDPHAVVLFESRVISDGLNADYVGRQGDVLVGFMAQKDVQLRVSIADKHEWDVHLKAQTFAYALHDIHCVPLINLAFNEVRVGTVLGSIEDVKLIYAVFTTPDRRILCFEGCMTGLVQRFPDCVKTYKSGMIDAPGREVTLGRHVLPPLRD